MDRKNETFHYHIRWQGGWIGKCGVHERLRNTLRGRLCNPARPARSRSAIII
jgi:hypothetical protein